MTHTIVCLSSQPWHDLWTNKQHIMSRLGKRHRVLHVNFGPNTSPRLLLGGPRSKQIDGVTVVDVFAPGGVIQMLDPSHPLRIFAHFDIRTRQLSRYLDKRGIVDPILWVYHPGYGAQAARIKHRLLVYDCVDEYSQFPEYHAHPQWLIDRERALCRRADVVFATAKGLFERKRAFNPDNTYLIHNVGDADHFSKALDSEVEVPPELQRLDGPIIGFVGAVSNYKLNVEWVTALARARRDYNVVLIGPANVGDAKSNVAPLTREPNIHLLGRRDYAELPAYIKGFDVATIPYRSNEYTSCVFPIKFFELMATGKPLVISPLPALEDYWSSALVARDADDFIDKCVQAVADPSCGESERRALAARNTWASRIDKMMAQIERRL